MNTSDFAQRLADKLIEQLKEGTAPWQQPWTEGQAFGPYNPTTGNRYRGVNILALLATQYTDPRWMTYKQAQSQGWQVRAGEKSTQIQHWIWEEEQVRLDKNGQPVLDDRGKLVKDLVRLQRPKVIAAAVFNAQQIDGIPELEPIRELRWDAIEQAEKLLMASNARIEHSQGGGAYYRLSTDTIHLPARERFASAGDYYSTALHELGHYAVSWIMPDGRVWRPLCLLAAMRQFGIIELMGNDEVWWKADLWLLVTPTKRRADRVQPPFCATSVQAILKNLHWEIL